MDSQTTGNEEHLVLLAQAGKAKALDQLLEHYEDALFRHVYRIVGNEELAYDTLQETYLVIMRSIKRLRSRSKFKAWAYGVATRVALKQRSKSYRRGFIMEETESVVDPLESADSLLAEKEVMEKAFDRLLYLSPALRSVMLLHFIEGFTLGEVAQAMELPLGTVKSRLAAGLAKLRSELARSV